MRTIDGRTFVTRMTTDTSKFNLSGAIKELDELNRSLINNQHQQKECNRIISESQKELKKLETEMKEDGKDTEENRQKREKLNQTIEQEKIKLAQLRSEQTAIRQVMSQVSREVAEQDKQWTVLKATIANLASEGLKVLSQKLLEIGRNVIQTGEEFTASMSEVGAITGATASELEYLEQTAREFGATTKFSASEAAQALKYMALAGWDAQQSADALGGILDLAAASGMQLAQASDMVTDYLAAFGMQAKDSAYMADLLTFAQSNSNTSAQQLGQAWGNCAANMNAAGQDIETTTALLEAMANQGLKGSEAGTALAAMMRDITDKMENGSISIGNVKVAVADAEGNFRDLTDILKDVQKATDSLGTAEKAAALSATFSARSLKGMNLVLNEGMDSISGYEEALRGSTGAAADAAKTMSDNLSGDIKTMQSAFEELALCIYEDGETPLRGLVQLITREGVPAIKTLIDHIDEIAPLFVGAAVAVGSYKASIVALSVAEGAAQAIKKLTAATQAQTAAQEAANVAMAANPIGLIAAAAGALAGILTTVSLQMQTAAKDTDRFRIAAENCIDSIQQAERAASANTAQTEAQAKTVESLAREYDELRSKTDLTAREQKTLDSVASELAKTLGTTVDKLRDESGAYRDLTQDIDDYLKKLREQVRFENDRNRLTAAYTSFDAAVEKAHAAKEALDAYSAEQKKQFDRMIEAENKSGKRIGNAELDRYRELTEQYGEYSFQVIKAADAIINYEEKLGGVSDREERLNELLAESGITAEEYGAKMSTSSGATDDLGKSAENAAVNIGDLKESIDGMTDGEVKLTAANKALLQLQSRSSELTKEISDLNKQIYTAEKDGNRLVVEELKKKREALQEEKAQIETNKTTIRGYIKEIKEGLDETATDLLEKINSVLGTIESVKKEAQETGRLSLSTLSSIVKKYPELSDAVKDYTIGLKTVGDVIGELEEIYEDDVRAYKRAVAAKLLEDGEYKDAVNGTAEELVEIFKDVYGVDLRNFANATEAKEAILDNFKKKMDEAWEAYWSITQQYEVGVENGKLVYYKDGVKAEDQAAAAKVVNEGWKTYSDAADRYNEFDRSDFAENLAAQIINTFESFDPTKFYGGSGSGAGSGSSGSGKITLSTKDATGTGDTYAQAYLDWMNKMKALGKISTENEIKRLEELKKRTDLNADDRYRIELALYNAINSLKKDEEQKDNDRVKTATEAYNKLIQDRIDKQKKLADEAKKTADKEIAAIDAVMKKRQEEQDDEKRRKEIKSIEDQLKYKQLDDISRYELKKRLTDLRTEQAEVDYTRSMEAQKTNIRTRADAFVTNADAAIARLNDAVEKGTYAIAQQAGTLTTSQVINHNNTQQNWTVVQNNLSDSQLLDRLRKMIYSG